MNNRDLILMLTYELSYFKFADVRWSRDEAYGIDLLLLNENRCTVAATHLTAVRRSG